MRRRKDLSLHARDERSNERRKPFRKLIAMKTLMESKQIQNVERTKDRSRLTVEIFVDVVWSLIGSSRNEFCDGSVVEIAKNVILRKRIRDAVWSSLASAQAAILSVFVQQSHRSSRIDFVVIIAGEFAR